MTTLREFIEDASVTIETMFNDRQVIHPMYHFVTGDDREVVMPAVGATKDQAVANARAVFAKFEAKRYIFIDEAWMLVTDRESELRRKRSLEHDPGRVEIVFFAAEDSDGGMVSAHRNIIRKVNSRARLGPLVFGDFSHHEGRMVGLLPRGKLAS